MWQKIKKIVSDWHGPVLIIPCVVGITVVLRWVGWLQPIEWTVLDFWFQNRPLELPDNRILIVAVEESDIQKLKQWPMSDKLLADLLTKIKNQQPRVIGLDLYRDLPVPPGHDVLVNLYKSTPNLIGIEKVINDSSSYKVNPAPELEQLGQVSSNDVVVDGDGVVRRGILFPMPQGKEELPSFGLDLAAEYLKVGGIVPATADNQLMKIGKTVFVPFKANDGGYMQADDGGYQILLNYRGPAQSFPTVSLSDILENRVPSNLIRDHIVLIGAEATSLNDIFYTPYSRELVKTPARTYGVEIQANLTSQIISSVLDDRPLIKVLSEPLQDAWILICAGVIPIFVWKFKKEVNLSSEFTIETTAGVLLVITCLAGSSYLGFQFGWWIPIVPSLLASCLAAISITGYMYVSKLRESNTRLEVKLSENSLLYNELLRVYKKLEEYSLIQKLKIEESTQSLEKKNEELERTIGQLKDTQKQLVIKEKLAFLGDLTTVIAHEIRKPLNTVNEFAKLCMADVYELRDKVKIAPPQPEQKVDKLLLKDLDISLLKITDKISEIQKKFEVADKIIRNMLLYVHTESIKREKADINSLISDSVKFLSYHKNYDEINIKVNLDTSTEQISIIVQDIKRALINIFNNAYYAIQNRKEKNKEDFKPTILIETTNKNDVIEITIRDNGERISQEVEDIFTPFFMFESSKKGGNLALSLSYNIIVGQHQGEIKLETEAGGFSKITVLLPKKST